MSFAFIAAMTKYPQMSYVQLLRQIREELQGRYDQKPQLSSSHRECYSWVIADVQLSTLVSCLSVSGMDTSTSCTIMYYAVIDAPVRGIIGGYRPFWPVSLLILASLVTQASALHPEASALNLTDTYGRYNGNYGEDMAMPSSIKKGGAGRRRACCW